MEVKSDAMKSLKLALQNIKMNGKMYRYRILIFLYLEWHQINHHDVGGRGGGGGGYCRKEKEEEKKKLYI